MRGVEANLYTMENDISTTIRRASVQQPQSQQERVTATSTENNNTTGNGGDSESFSFSGFFSQLLSTNPELVGALTTFEKYIPFVLILVIKQLYDHSTGTKPSSARIVFVKIIHVLSSRNIRLWSLAWDLLPCKFHCQPRGLAQWSAVHPVTPHRHI